jgi:capsular exopolysaccharide synthesis family protein
VPAKGKSTTLVNLAYICAQGGYTTLMIDADLRRPRLHTFFDINNSVGLTNYLTTELMLEDVILQTPVDNLYFMPSGILPADAAGILNSRRMSELIQDVKQRFDLVLVDSPPILGVSDASVLASEVDLTMLVVQHRKLPRNMLLRVKQAVENVGGTCHRGGPQQRGCPQRQPVPILHQLLHLLRACRSLRSCSGIRTDPAGQGVMISISACLRMKRDASTVLTGCGQRHHQHARHRPGPGGRD